MTAGYYVSESSFNDFFFFNLNKKIRQVPKLKHTRNKKPARHGTLSDANEQICIITQYNKLTVDFNRTAIGLPGNWRTDKSLWHAVRRSGPKTDN